MWSVSSAIPQPQRGLSPERLARLSEIEREHFWFVARRSMVARLVRRHCPRGGSLVEIGCGTGYNLESLRSWVSLAAGLDLRREGLSGKMNVAQGDGARLPFAADSFDSVLLLDLLEHTEERAVLQEVRRVLKRGGSAIVSAPAYSWLWSYRDQAAGHLRRYSKRSLEGALREAELEPRESGYYQCLLFPLAAVSRLMGRNGPRARDLEDAPPAAINRLFTRINLTEVRLGEHIPWPWGTTLVTVARKVTR